MGMDTNFQRIAASKPKNNPPSVAESKSIPIIGNIPTKSDALLHMLIQLPKKELSHFLTYDKDEIKKLPKGRKGLRIYSVSGLKKGKIGGREYHRLKKEFFFMVRGKLRIECEDVYGKKRSFIVDSTQGLYIPPFIAHTYKVLEEGNFIVVTNTIFDRSDKRTHDLYPLEAFLELQTHYRGKKGSGRNT